MTPQERKLIDELFDRLASLEKNPRDPEAVRAINEGLQRAPNALYPLVQTALVQDEALKRADARIRELEQELELEPGEPAKQPGFLDTMRDALVGRPHSSVPSVRQRAPAEASPWSNTAARPGGFGQGGYGAPVQPGGYGAPQQQVGAPGGSFLGTAAATAAGVVGGALLMNSFRGMFGGQNQGQGHSAFDSGSGGGTPWSPDAGGGSLSQEAGLSDIGPGGGRTADYGDGSQRAGLFDAPQSDDSNFDNDDFDVGGDGGSDSA
jgi:hypothetical protein